MFSKDTYQQRRSALIEKLDSGLILLLGNEESPMNYPDNAYPFRQDSSFLYYVGLDKPHLAAVLDVDAGTTTLFGDDFSIDMIVWMGPQPTTAEMAEKSGISNTKPYNDLPQVLQAAQAKERDIHYLPPYRGESKIKLSKWLGIPLAEINQRASLPLIQAVIAQRAIKSAEEIEEMSKAVTVSGKMHTAAMKSAKPGMTEAMLRAVAEANALSTEGYPAYPVILTVNGQTLHNHHHGNTLESGQLVLGDFGAATKMHYAGDITRTFPVDASFTEQQRDIYNIVLKAETDAINALQPGKKYLDIHLLAANIIAEGLKDVGIMKGNTADAVASGAHALFFPHGLGHMIGLDVHDMEDLGEDYVGYDETVARSAQFGLKSLRLARALQPGFVLTVEPGIYFIPELIDIWQSEGKFKEFINYDQLAAYRQFGGIRIEDDVLVTANGSEILGEPIPKTVGEVEAIRSNGDL